MKMFRVVVNGSEYKVGIEELAEESASQPSQVKAAPSPKVTQPKPTVKAQPKPAAAKKAEPAAAGGTVVAPMPGTVLQVAVNKGDNVTKGQTLLVLEAMKMENEIMAPADGVVQEVNVTQGVSVNAGDILIVLSS
ncbi:MAG: biotin/lipoyl-binding protein [Desulfovibrionaceae bacterium]|jgi:glutaconyl-CoA decarboxylase|nr:biotin/lipoyl-binding protein [Desulfovibrionaceae bacterium]